MSGKVIPPKELRSLFETHPHHPFRSTLVYLAGGYTRYEQTMEEIEAMEKERKIKKESLISNGPTPMNIESTSSSESYVGCNEDYDGFDLPDDFDMNIIYTEKEIDGFRVAATAAHCVNVPTLSL